MTARSIALLAAALIAAGSVSAQYVGPGASQVFTSIASVLRSAPDDARVELEGRIVQQVGKEKYLFTDGKDQIRVEIEAEDFPKLRVDEKTRLRIAGEVEKDFLESPEIDVDAVTVL